MHRPVPPHLILASSSMTRLQMLRSAGLTVEAMPARVDEDAVKRAMVSEGANPRDVADALAEGKARKVAGKQGGLVLGCDQVLAFEGEVLSKPENVEDAKVQLLRLGGQRHMLFSAAVIYEDAKPVWRHVGVARMHMRAPSPGYLEDYLDRNWDSVRHSVGGYKVEEEGARLFTRIEGDQFTVLGMPLLEILSYLVLRGTLSA